MINPDYNSTLNSSTDTDQWYEVNCTTKFVTWAIMQRATASEISQSFLLKINLHFTLIWLT